MAGLAAGGTPVVRLPWGPDISGSFGGAGGNGGVLIFKDHTSTVNESFYPAYDAQGNVYGLIDMSGNLDAAYEYDPFGKCIRHAGTRKDSMSLLYGTKYTDMETGLIYYGYRYYDPRQGRFINRDPIGEEGGLNLYAMLGNSPVNAVDYLGLEEIFVQNCGLWQERSYWVEETSEFSPGLKHWFWRTEAWQTGCWIEKPEGVRNPPNGDGGGSRGGGRPTGNGDDPPGKDDDPPKEEEPPKEKELPPCSELKAKFESGEYSPTLTSESFIPDAEVSAGPLGLLGFETFHGDGRGFLDSPSDGSPGRTSRISATVEYDDSTFFPTPSIRIDQSTRTRWWGATSRSATGSASSIRGYSIPTGTGASKGLEYRGSNPLAPRVLLPTTQNFNEIRMQAAVNVDFTTGMLNGSYSRSAFPAAQLFYDGKPIANLPASELGPSALMGLNESGQINGIQICDPSK